MRTATSRSPFGPPTLHPPSPSRGATRRGPAVAAAGLLALLLTGLLAGCGSGSDGDQAATDPCASAASGNLPEWAPEILTDSDDNVVGFDFSCTPEPSSDLQVELLTTGDGPDVVAGQTITADYLGEVYDADEPFDSSFSTEPFQAQIGAGRLIPGWDQALVGVPVGSRVLLSIPPDLGYGSAGQGAAIPPDSPLFFVVDIIDAA